jgi:hypothetical protein
VRIVRSSMPKTSPSAGNEFTIWMPVILCEGSVLETPKKNRLALLLLVVRFVATVAVSAALEGQEKFELVRCSPSVAHIRGIEADSRDRRAEGEGRIDQANGVEESRA